MSADAQPVRPHRARRGEGERLRDELLTVAEELLLELGSMDAVSMRAIAQRTGVTPPAIYLHFADKEELFFEVCQVRFFEFASTFVAAVQDIDDPVEQLRTMGRTYVDWALENREHYAVLFGGGISIPASVDIMTSPGRIGLTALISIIERGIERGLFIQVDPTDAAIAMWSIVHGFVHLTTHKADFVPDLNLVEARDQVIELAVRGLLK